MLLIVKTQKFQNAVKISWVEEVCKAIATIGANKETFIIVWSIYIFATFVQSDGVYSPGLCRWGGEAWGHCHSLAEIQEFQEL